MKKIKIALVGFRLNSGGCGRVIANLSKYFNEQDIDVHIIIFHDDLGYDFSGTLFNLGKLKSKSNTILNKIKRLHRLRKYLREHEFDYIIDFRFRKSILQELLISKLAYNSKTIYTIHSSRLEVYLPKSKFWTKVIYGNSYKIIAITEVMKEMVLEKYPQLKNVNCIYNPIIIEDIQSLNDENIDLSYKYIIGVGQFDTNQKQFDKLIKAYSNSELPNKGIQLIILGDGNRLESLKLSAKSNNVSNKVHFLGFKTNPFKYIKNAEFFVLSSWHEGHPMVLIESLACGTPVIAFNCPTGPKEVIFHGENGLLIKDQNIEELSNAMDLMTLDENLYNRCKINALKSIEKFELNSIGPQWLNLLS